MNDYYNINESTNFSKYKSQLDWISAVYDRNSYNDFSKPAYIDASRLMKNSRNAESLINSLITQVNADGDGNKFILLPVAPWFKLYGDEKELFKESNINPISAIYVYLRDDYNKFKRLFKDIKFYITTYDSCFILDPNTINGSTYKNFKNLISSASVYYMPIKPKTKYLTGSNAEVNPMRLPQEEKRTKEQSKDLENKIMEIINDIVDNSDSEEEANAAMESNEKLKALLAELDSNNQSNISTASSTVNINKVRSRRMSQLNTGFMDLEIKGKSVKDMMRDKVNEELPTTSFKIDTINDEWNNMKFVNFEKKYDLDSDIVKCLYHFTKTSNPISIRGISVEDTSNTEDYIDTYTVECEDANGKRFTLKFDVPQFVNNRFMRLGGNDKIINGQLLLLPCIKSENDTAQMVSNYNKVFVYRYGMVGRSYSSSDRLIKALSKAKNISDIKISTGNNSKICAKYNLYADYIDLAANFNEIETNNYRFIFNQDFYRTIDEKLTSKDLVIYISKKDNYMAIYKDIETPISTIIANMLCQESPEFAKLYEKTVKANKMAYSQASILNKRVPAIVVLGYLLGLTQTMKRAKIEYHMVDKKVKPTDADLAYMSSPNEYDAVKFNDGYIYYKQTYESSMLMNGLFDCDTENYSLGDIDDRKFWLDQLDIFGGRIMSDGLDNFNDLFIDPMTEEVCEKYKLPTNFCDMLIYASNLLVDTQYNRHTDITGNRYRTNEIIAGYVYKELSKAYAQYRSAMKHGKKQPMQIKQNAIIISVMTDSMSSDLSTMTALLEREAANTVSFKGLSGMNSDRSYSLDKRTFDDSMINKLGLSTGFAGNVGITRQATLDMDIEGERGYIKDSSIKDMSDVKTLSITEALTPFGTTRDDPFRSAMTFVQSSKHSMRTKGSAPLLITNGSDDALPYMIGNTFVFKAKNKGKVIELTEDYMILEYDDGSHDYVDLSVRVKKNSDGGIYVTVQLQADKKLNSTFKKDEIVAHDPLSFSDKYGATDELSYNLGTLAKVGILTTDEGFEDSTICSEWLSEAMTSDVTMMDDVILPYNTNLYFLVKPGTKVQEGDTLMIFQNAFEEEEQNALLKNLTNVENLSDLGRIKKKSHYTGVIQDVKIYRTKPIEYYSESLQKVIKEYESRYKKKIDTYKKYGITGIQKEVNNYELPAQGKLKNASDGLLIEIYVTYEDKFSIGDKNVAQSACKGVCKDIFPSGKEPWSEYRPNEKIHAFYAINSFMGRMITSVMVSGGINKGLIELDRQVKDIMGIKWKSIEDMQLKV